MTAGVAAAVWAVRSRSSSVFGPSVWRGPQDQRILAVTFDDGPSEGTPELLELLSHLGIPATFFMCGAHVQRLPDVARAVRDAGHEIGNHTQNHPLLCMRQPAFLRTELTQAQQNITEVTGVKPRWFRAPYGVRWPGLAGVQQELGLTGVMWTVIGFDWTFTADRIAARVLKHAGPGGIICLHDGRELKANPDISQTIEAVRIAIPELLRRGYQFRTVTGMFG